MRYLAAAILATLSLSASTPFSKITPCNIWDNCTYYTYMEDKYLYGTDTVVSGLLKAAKLLHATGTLIGIGRISSEQGGKLKGHKSHRDGSDFDLRPISTSGIAGRFTYKNKSYSRDKTYIALVVILDAIGINNIDLLVFNDVSLINQLKEHYKDNQDVFQYDTYTHNNHIHISTIGELSSNLSDKHIVTTPFLQPNLDNSPIIAPN